MPQNIQRMFDCQSKLLAIQIQLVELDRQLRAQPRNDRLRQRYHSVNREALGLSCLLTRLASGG